MLDLIESIAGLRVLFLGDDIVDEYHYVTALGKSPKENLVPVCYESSEEFSGGTRAAAKHAQAFCAEVTVLCPGRTTRKTRFVERPYLRKLFEVHRTEDVFRFAAPRFSDYDVVVVTDFGHGAMTPALVRDVREAKFLAVCAQTNSANVGFNLITKYAGADYIVIDEPEARLAAADRDSPIEDVILKLASGRCDKFVVTHGSAGAIGWDRKRFHRSPAFTDRVVDTMGAGDAFFAVTAPMARTGNMADLLRIGNAAGALKTQIVGHRNSVTKEALIEYLKAHS